MAVAAEHGVDVLVGGRERGAPELMPAVAHLHAVAAELLIALPLLAPHLLAKLFLDVVHFITIKI